MEGKKEEEEEEEEKKPEFSCCHFLVPISCQNGYKKTCQVLCCEFI
jgi:hypothetical protein